MDHSPGTVDNLPGDNLLYPDLGSIRGCLFLYTGRLSRGSKHLEGGAGSCDAVGEDIRLRNNHYLKQ